MKIVFYFTLLLLTSCATITSDAPYPVEVKGDEKTKAVYRSNEYSLPAVINVRPSDPEITFIHECSEPKTITLDKSFRIGATVFGNILWIVPGLIVDIITGEMWKIEDSVITAPPFDKTPNCKTSTSKSKKS